MSLTLLDKQQKFSQLVAELIQQCYRMGYQVTLGEAHRPKAVAALYAQEDTEIAIKNSLHCQRLAIDLNLFKAGIWLTKNEDYRDIGQWWESMSSLDYTLVWGGRFGDADHFSMEHQGVK